MLRRSQYTLTMQREPAPPSIQIYEILLREELDEEVAAWLTPLTVTHAANGATMLTVPVRDQAELHGLLIKVRDLNLTLIGVRHVEQGQQDAGK
jgi:hypothetical protein